MIDENLMRIRFDYGPDTDVELMLKQQLRELYERYQMEAQPILDQLVRIASTKAPTVFFLQEENLGK